MKKALVVGAGLAGSEATWQLISRNIPVELHEMRPKVSTKAHKTSKMAELVCSNSFRGDALSNAVGLLKEELRLMGSLVMKAAEKAKVPAGGALAVDREVFSQEVDSTLRDHPLVDVRVGECLQIPEPHPDLAVIIATGPLTSEALMKDIKQLTGESHLAFYDAISPIILEETIDLDQVFRMSRYEKGGGDDYLNIPFTKEQYYSFVESIERAEKHTAHADVEEEALRPFEGCMPIEDMVERGKDTPLFGPLKPVGLIDPKTGKQPYAVMQLRQDNKEGTLWSMVGMQTRMKHGAQLEIFRSLPGLEKAEFVRLGSVHRNSFMNSPHCLEPTLAFKNKPGLFFAGQITGVEGYVESTAGGMVAGINAERYLQGKPLWTFPTETATGGLLDYISCSERKDFQPMNISFGLISSYSSIRLRKKKERRLKASEMALQKLEEFLGEDKKLQAI